MSTRIKHNQTQPENTKDLLQKVLHEIQALRKDIEIFMPTETIEEYDNAPEIKKNFKDALREFPRT